MKSPFIQPRFNGSRFDEHTLPLEVARDLAAYETLVVEVAKHLYLSQHTDRQRVPKGFTADFHLHLERIDDGCARPLLSVVIAGTLGLSGGAGNYFEQARDLITECVAAAEGQLPHAFPQELLSYFNQVGRSLREGESLELPRADSAKPAVLTPETRKRLVLAASTVYEREIELAGTISEADWEKSTFRLRLADGSQSIVPMPLGFHPKAREFGGRGRHQVTVSGIATFDSWDRLQKVISVESLEIQQNHELVRKFDEFTHLSDGWLDGMGVAPDKEALSFISEKIEAHYPERLPLPSIVPTPEGGLLFEWNVLGDPSIDLSLQTLIAEFHSFGAGNNTEIEREFYLADDNAWDQLFAFLSEHLKEHQI